MTPTIARLYRQERQKQWECATMHRFTYGTTMAKAAFDRAKTHAAFTARDDVRICFPPDETSDLEDLKGDTFNPSANPDIPRTRLVREEREFEEKVEREGVVGIVGEYFDGEDWRHADSVWGFVGEEDARDSGYMEDVMEETMRQADAAEQCPTCHRPTRQG